MYRSMSASATALAVSVRFGDHVGLASCRRFLGCLRVTGLLGLFRLGRVSRIGRLRSVGQRYERDLEGRGMKGVLEEARIGHS